MRQVFFHIQAVAERYVLIGIAKYPLHRNTACHFVASRFSTITS